MSYTVRNHEVTQLLTYTSLSGTRVSRVSLPVFSDDGDLLQWLLLENVPGSFFPTPRECFRSSARAKIRPGCFSGEGDAFPG
ncbi:MAG: hypothetical protein CM1200mP20_14220 [Pseudomonadota bacterium]|nr:MAG: hypothetical protein CM1200mP20_14220 [Pseudomonadota bacterium]